MKLQNAIEISIMIVCLGVLPKLQAVVPAPDGGYAGGNTAEGKEALLSLTTGGFNTAVGFLSLRSNNINSFNTAIGAGALLANIGAGDVEGSQNTATGAAALLSNTSGFENTANGAFALFSNTIGAHNTALGKEAVFSNIAGDFNTAVGSDALSRSTSNGNTALGASAGIVVTTAENVICIGSLGANVSNSCFIGHIRGVTTAQSNAIPVLIDSAGQLGTTSSSRRFKKEIKPMDESSEAILGLKPATFHYKSDKTNRPQFGLIAEEVAEVNPDLVVRDENGEIYTVRYDSVNAMLLNEFLKEHRRVQKLETNDAEQQREIEGLVTMVKEQAAQIQKVSAQLPAASRSDRGLEASIPVPQVVNNP
jgi:Chaperone of endosialidase